MTNVEARLQRRASLRSAARAAGTVTIPVWVHVIKDSTGTGALTSAQIDAQIAVLNSAYGGNDSFTWDGRSVSEAPVDTPFRFTLAGTDVTTNSTWFDAGPDTTAERQMKSALRQGGPETLNLYTTGGAGYLGWATFPWWYDGDPADDGVGVRWDSLPNTTSWVYGYGDTATHETGHWLGLYHTFQGGCNGAGDEVDDTPAERSSTFGCPNPVPDTCSTVGKDPIYNFMDYTDDECMFVFSSGQTTRMDLMHADYRTTVPACTSGADCDDSDACTDDTCNGGTCSNTAISCDDGNACTAETCDPVNGCGSTPITCDDHNECTSDSCNTASGCSFAALPGGTACSGGTCDGAGNCVGAGGMHVGDLDGSSASNGPRWTAYATVSVHDGAHGALAGATVTGSWSSGETTSCTTTANGQCTVSLSGIRKKQSSRTFTVSDVAASGQSYTASQNHDPDGDSNGTSIAVHR